IWIHWKKGRPEAKQYGDMVQFVRTKYDEFTPPPPEAVEYYYRPVRDGDDTFTGQIEPTAGNRASRYYNEQRKRLMFKETALRSMLSDGPVKWSSRTAM